MTKRKIAPPPELVVRTQGTVSFGSGDFFRTDRGITWGVKVTDADGMSFVMAFIKTPEGPWAMDSLNESMIDSDFSVTVASQYGGDVAAWFRGKFVPGLNAWLAKKFPAVAPTALSPAEQADTMINSMRITRRADGTLYVE